MSVRRNPIQQKLAYGQASLLSFLVICYALIPHYVLTEGGVSNYGTRPLTVVPYTLAFVLSALLTAYAAKLLPHQPKPVNVVRISLYILAFLLGCVLMSTYPYLVNHFWNEVHARTFMILVSFELLLGIYLVAKIRHDRLMYLLLVMQIVGASLLALNLGGLHVLFAAQQVAGVAFGLVLITAAAYL